MEDRPEDLAKRNHDIRVDLFFLTLSIFVAVFILKSDVIYSFISSLGEMSWLGVLIAGMFFTSVFTTVPAIAVLGELALVTPLSLLVVVGGIGAVLGDYILYKFVKNKVTEDFKYILSSTQISQKFSKIIQTRIFRFFVPFLGALVIASPLPDEFGVALLGLSKVKTQTFILISFVFNALGILVIGLLATSVGA